MNKFWRFCFRFALSFPVFSLDIARYAIGKGRKNLLAINMEISTKSNDRFGLNGAVQGVRAKYIWRVVSARRIFE